MSYLEKSFLDFFVEILLMTDKCKVWRKKINNGEIKYCRRNITDGEKISNQKNRLYIDDEFYFKLKTDASSSRMELKDFIKNIFNEHREDKDNENNN